MCVNGVFFGGQMAEGVIRLQELMRMASVCVCVCDALKWGNSNANKCVRLLAAFLFLHLIL